MHHTRRAIHCPRPQAVVDIPREAPGGSKIGLREDSEGFEQLIGRFPQKVA